jgi:hypothetical protein
MNREAAPTGLEPCSNCQEPLRTNGRRFQVPDSEFEPPEQPELLSLGIIGGGMTPQNELIIEALQALMRAVRDRRGQYPNGGLRINIVFHVPGRFTKPDFQGVFPARYARKTSHMLVNAAVPESLQLDGLRKYFTDALSETKIAAAEYLRKRRIQVDTTNVMAFIDDLVADRSTG